MTPFIEKYQTTIIRIIVAVGVLLTLFLLAATLGKLKEHRFIGSGVSPAQTITVAGTGKVNRAPDTAKISFTVRAEDKQVKNAQQVVSGKIDAVTKVLKDIGIEERYIKTDYYNSYPKYEYGTVACRAAYCPPAGTPKLVGYEVSHAITVNVKDLDKVEEVLGALGTAGVSDISGPNFGFEDDKAVQREARDMAIKDAREQAQLLARSLGVKIVRLVSFSENGGAYPLYRESLQGKAYDAATAAPVPALPVGDQEISANITLTYEIR
ncbi:MAG TPA: SIMPL domain-containing protein [Candidatus Paceibacterota bacterium]|nr:SIMPL domain-containing protein [Candidatus Paceibacterota bacterium]